MSNAADEDICVETSTVCSIVSIITKGSPSIQLHIHTGYSPQYKKTSSTDKFY